MMTDRYEEFKEWFKKKSHRYGVWKIDDNGNQEICHYSRAFIDFEEEQAKKEKEKEIKKVLDKYIVKIGFTITNGEGIKINGNAVDKCYNELKERDLIKWLLI